MKALCPICNIEGFLEQRGSNARIKHYLGFENGKRKYQYHTVELSKVIPVDSQIVLGINKTDLSPKGENMVRRVGFEPTNPCGIRASVLRL
jgi:hypothetical protein